VRRDRTYELSLIAHGAPPRPLSSLAFAETSVPSRHIFRVAPGGQWLAFRSADGLSLMNARHQAFPLCSEFEDFRFSPDGRQLAVAKRVGSAVAAEDLRRPDALVIYDLTGAAPRRLRSLPIDGIAYIEWSARGVIVQHSIAPLLPVQDSFKDELSPKRDLSGNYRGLDVRPSADPLVTDDAVQDELLLAPPLGAPSTIYRGAVDRFASAGRATRVVVFAREGVVDIDLAHPKAKRVSEKPGVFGFVDNIEMAADGSEVLVALKDEGIYAINAAGRQRPLATGRIGALWSTDEGARFVWSAADGLHLGAAGRYPLVGPDAAAVRFRRDAPGLITIEGGQIVTRNDDGNLRAALSLPLTGRPVGADHFAGGLVLWLEQGERREHDED
jgi:hypothetical protein